MIPIFVFSLRVLLKAFSKSFNLLPLILGLSSNLPPGKLFNQLALRLSRFPLPNFPNVGYASLSPITLFYSHEGRASSVLLPIILTFAASLDNQS